MAGGYVKFVNFYSELSAIKYNFTYYFSDKSIMDDCDDLERLLQELANEQTATERVTARLHAADHGLNEDKKKVEQAQQELAKVKELKRIEVLADIAKTRYEREQKEIRLTQVNAEREHCQSTTAELNSSCSKVFVLTVYILFMYIYIYLFTNICLTLTCNINCIQKYAHIICTYKEKQISVYTTTYSLIISDYEDSETKGH